MRSSSVAARGGSGARAPANASSLSPTTPTLTKPPKQDLEYLIEKCVDPQRADFALVAGVQIHNWSRGCVEEANLEFVAPTKVYVVVEGEVTMLDLLQLPVSVGL